MTAVFVLDAHASGAGQGPSSSGEPSRKATVEISTSLLFDEDISENSLGVRGSYFFTDRFALEGSLSRFRVDDDLDVQFLDLTAKYYLRPRSRSPLYFAGGPTKLFRQLDDLDDGRLLFHAGFGSEISLGRKFYVRPELLFRWVEDDFDTWAGDLSLGFGWSF